MAKVPTGRDFVEDAPADIMLLQFADIFDVFHQNRLYQTLVCLFFLSMAMQVIRDKSPGFVIVDPYYMRDSQLSTWECKKVASEYLSVVMRKNIGKDLLMSYFPK
jgi:hypothetical protein